MHTDFDTSYVYAPSETDLISFTLTNTGNEKIWNYEKFNVIVTYNASIGGVPTMTTERFTFNSAQAFASAGESAVLATPDLDITNDNAWDDPPDGNNNNILYDDIDELTRNDADYVTSGPMTLLGDQSETLEVGLSNVDDPQSSSGHKIRYAFKKSAPGNPQLDLTVTLLQGTTTIATTPTENNINQNFRLGEYVLSAAEADSITDYSDLRLRFNAVYGGGITLNTRSAIISWATLVVPAPEGVYDCSAVSISSGEWTIDTIYGDLQDPEIINTNEDGKICIDLSHDRYPSTDITMIITTDVGKTKSSEQEFS
jgi:hypothetical protein